MLPGTSSLSKTALIEQLIFIAGEVSSVSSTITRTFPESGALPETAVIDKMLRQDVKLAKSRVDSTVDKLLEYLAASRLELVDHKEFFINIAIRYKKIMDRLETTVHRLFLLRKKLPESEQDKEVNEYIKKLLKMQEKMLFTLSSSIRALLSVNHGTREMLRSIESDFTRMKLTEENADETYREAFELVLDKFQDSMLGYVLYREVIDTLEDSIDESLEQGRDILILARSLSE
jgi:uncharacterized UPF0160 family protein